MGAATATGKAAEEDKDEEASVWELAALVLHRSLVMATPEVPESLQMPLASYYVSSSHNTCMEGDQLFSQARAAMFEYALLQGCRCLELDLWDDANGAPVLAHGPTTMPGASLEASIQMTNPNPNPEPNLNLRWRRASRRSSARPSFRALTRSSSLWIMSAPQKRKTRRLS